MAPAATSALPPPPPPHTPREEITVLVASGAAPLPALLMLRLGRRIILMRPQHEGRGLEDTLSFCGGEEEGPGCGGGRPSASAPLLLASLSISVCPRTSAREDSEHAGGMMDRVAQQHRARTQR